MRKMKMKKFEDLNKEEKQKFNAYLTLKGLMRADFNHTTTIAFIALLFGVFLFVSVSIIGLNILHMGMTLESTSVMNSGMELVQSSTIIGFMFAIIFFLILFLAYYRKQQDDKILYSMFEINDVTKDMMEIDKEDLKKVKLGFRKVK